MISLKIEVEVVDGVWIGTAPWGTAEGDSFEDVYYKLLKTYHEQAN